MKFMYKLVRVHKLDGNLKWQIKKMPTKSYLVQIQQLTERQRLNALYDHLELSFHQAFHQEGAKYWVTKRELIDRNSELKSMKDKDN